MDKMYVYVFRTVSEDPEGRSQITEQHGLYRGEGPAVTHARKWIELTLADWDDPDASVKEWTNPEGTKFILTMYGYDGEWMHKAIVEKVEVL